MKALVYDGGLHLSQVPSPASRTEAMLKVRRAGVCGTDIALIAGTYQIDKPKILGHEFVAEVFTPLPGMPASTRGRRVVSEINVTCGRCYFCRGGMRTHCLHRTVLGIQGHNGCFAEFVTAPPENLHYVPDGIDDDSAVLVEPLAAAIEMTVMSPVEPRASCAVIGPGRLGLLALQVLRDRGPTLLVAFGHAGRKLELAAQLGADYTFEPSEANRALRLTKGIGFDYVVETTGNPQGMDLAIDLARPRGTIFMKSTHGIPVAFNATRAVVKELRLQGSRCGPFERAIEMLQSGRVHVKPLITHRFALERFEEAFEAARSKDGIKVLFQVSD